MPSTMTALNVCCSICCAGYRTTRKTKSIAPADVTTTLAALPLWEPPVIRALIIATSAELEALKAAARQRLAAGQDELDLGLEHTAPVMGVRGGPLPITSSRMGHLCDALTRASRSAH
jgi:hypothetical protein